MLGLGIKGAALSAELRSGSLETQRRLILSLMPATRAALVGVLQNPEWVIALDFYAMLEECKGPEAFVQRLCQAARNKKAALYHKDRYMELLVLLWSQGKLLFPQDVRLWCGHLKWATLLNPVYSGDRSTLLVGTKAVMVHGVKNTDFCGLVHTFYATADIRDPHDVSLEIITAYEQRCLELLAERRLNKKACEALTRKLARVVYALRLYFNVQNPELAVIALRTRRKPHKDTSQVRLDGRFRWLVSAHPKLEPWANAMRDYIAQLTTITIRNHTKWLNLFADYLCGLSNPPTEPWQVLRNEHIYDLTLRNKQTFHEYLRTTVGPDDGRKALFQMRAFFDWYGDYLIASHNEHAKGFRNPVLGTDSLGKARTATGQTARNALPLFVLNEMKDVLIADDFAFARSYKTPTARVVDRETGAPVNIWYPGLAVCLFLMLETPVRSHQARWLDSGELDEWVYDPDSNTEVANPSPHAIAGRAEGVLRLQRDSLRNEAWLGLWVTTNKTAYYDSETVGFLIPYVSERLAKLLTMMIGWQKRYLPPMAAPIPYYADGQSIPERKRLDGKGPQVVPLFRDPSAFAQTQNTPITYQRLAGFYTAVLAETQKRIKEKHGHDIQLVTADEDGKLRWSVDLHSLRVSGITSMIESGVPLEVVSQFVAGHATLVMTLHYLKYSPLKLREFLADAHEKMLANTDFVGSELFSANLEKFAPFLLSQAGAGAGPGFSSLTEKTGIMTITSEGICPGTSCSTGGPAVDAKNIKHGPVPGGRRCGLCRYWITGPAHLLGQVVAVNNLAYTIRKKGLEVANLNDQRLDAEDEGNQSRARQLRDRVDALNLELAIDVEEWVARYKYASRSVTLMNDYLAAKAQAEGSTLPVALLTASSSPELKITLEEAHEFALLDQITQMSSFVTGFKNREAELEKNAILSRMMAANGLKPLLLGLDEQQAHEAGNLLSSVLLQQVRNQEVGDVLSGTRPLSDYPGLAQTIRCLETAVDQDPQLKNGDWKNLAMLLSGSNDNANENHDEEERRFG